jgi:hypothetical protein
MTSPVRIHTVAQMERLRFYLKTHSKLDRDELLHDQLITTFAGLSGCRLYMSDVLKLCNLSLHYSYDHLAEKRNRSVTLQRQIFQTVVFGEEQEVMAQRPRPCDEANQQLPSESEEVLRIRRSEGRLRSHPNPLQAGPNR